MYHLSIYAIQIGRIVQCILRAHNIDKVSKNY